MLAQLHYLVAVVRHAPVTMMGTRPRKSVAVNRLARRNYEILEDYEDGTSFYYVTARKGCTGWLKACYVDAVAP